MKIKLTALALGIVLLSITVSAPPEPPHRVYGQIGDENQDPVSDANVEFRYDGSTLVQNNTDNNGNYDVKIPYDSSYDGEEISMFVDGDDTTETVAFKSGMTTELNDNIEETQDPHSVSGTITDDGEEVEDALVEFIYDDEVVADDETDSSGDYSVDIPYDSNYDGENIEMHVEEENTDETVEFTSSGSTDLDFEADWLIDDENSENEENTDDSEDSSDGSSGGSGGSGGSSGGGTIDNSDDTDDDSSDSETDQNSDEESNEDTGPEIVFTDLTAPENVSTGETITIEITLENSGDESGEETFTVEAGGNSIEETTVTVGAAETETVEVDTNFEVPGVYTVTAGDLSSDITVEEQEQSESSLPIIPISVIILVIITSVYLGRNRILGLIQGLLESEASEDEEDEFGWNYAKKNNE